MNHVFNPYLPSEVMTKTAQVKHFSSEKMPRYDVLHSFGQDSEPLKI